MRDLVRILGAAVLAAGFTVCSIPVSAQSTPPPIPPPDAKKPLCTKLNPDSNTWTFFAPGQHCHVPYLLAPRLPPRQNGVPVSITNDDTDVVTISPMGGVTGFDGTTFIFTSGSKAGTAHIVISMNGYNVPMNVVTQYSP